MDDPEFESRQMQMLFLFSQTTRPVVGATHPSIQGYRGYFPEVKWMGLETGL
jgi:hypothetical protein